MTLTGILLGLFLFTLAGLGLLCLRYRALYFDAVHRHHDYVMNIRRQLEDLSDLLTGRNDI